MKNLAQNISWTTLKYLDLSHNLIDAERAKHLAQNTSWTTLQHLHLSNNTIGAEGAKYLSQNISWITLQYLNLRSNLISAEELVSLINGVTQKLNYDYIFHLFCLINNFRT